MELRDANGIAKEEDREEARICDGKRRNGIMTTDQLWSRSTYARLPYASDTLTMGNPHEMPQDPVSIRKNDTIMTTVKEAVPSGHGSSARTSLPQDVYRHATS